MANNQKKKTPYELPVVDTISTAWSKVNGAKGSVWAAIGIMLAIMFGLGMVQGVFQAIHPTLGSLASLIISLFNLLLQVGLVYIGISRAQEKPISFKLLFSALNKKTAINVFVLYILKLLILFVPILIAVIGATILMTYSQLLGGLVVALSFVSIIYITLRLFVALGYVLDQGANGVDAIKLSIKATKGSTLRLLGIAILQLLIFIVAIIPLGIGLIWAIPLGLIIYGTVYKRLSRSA